MKDLWIKSNTGQKVLAKHMERTDPEWLEEMKQVAEMYGPFNQLWWSHNDELLAELKEATAKVKQGEIGKMRKTLCQ